jgi:orotate phosphoribosyltransferase
VLAPSSKVIIVDDVLTTGGSAMEAVEEVEKIGCKVVAVVCIVDRLQGARELIEPHCPFIPLFTIRDFGVTPL